MSAGIDRFDNALCTALSKRANDSPLSWRTGVQSTDFSRAFATGKDPTEVGTLNTCHG